VSLLGGKERDNPPINKMRKIYAFTVISYDNSLRSITKSSAPNPQKSVFQFAGKK
jgi:hypothetical protein